MALSVWILSLDLNLDIDASFEFPNLGKLVMDKRPSRCTILNQRWFNFMTVNHY